MFERFIHGRNIFWSNPLSFPYPPISPQSLPLISPPNYICTFTFITHQIHLVLVSMCLGLGPSFGVWVVFWPHPWGKLTLPPRQLSIANGFSSKGWDFMNICWHFVWFALGQVLIHADTAILRSCVQWSCPFQRALTCCRPPLPLSPTVFPFSLLWWSVKLERNGVMSLAYLELNTPQHHALHGVSIVKVSSCLYTSFPIL